MTQDFDQLALKVAKEVDEDFFPADDEIDPTWVKTFARLLREEWIGSMEPVACMVPCGSVCATSKVDGEYFQIVWGSHHLATRHLYTLETK